MGGDGDSALRQAAARLGHDFADIGLLEQALTHPSITSPVRGDNQRFEFLGDRVLGLVIAEALLEAYPDAREGRLAPRLNELVRKETCAEVARVVGVDAWLRLGKSENRTGGRRKTAILGDAMEAVIAAVYLDGGMDAARDLVMRFWAGLIDGQGHDAPRDAKTALQEWAQGRGMRPPRYQTLDRSGPDHAPLFTVSVTLETGETAQAKAKSKRAAEQDAAGQLVDRLEIET